MKKLSYLLMAICLVFFVSCHNNNDTESAATENAATETESATPENAPKYEGSPAFVEVMTFLDEKEAMLENCDYDQFMEIHKLTFENVIHKYSADDITSEENETLRLRYKDFVDKVAEKAKDFNMGE
jgi:hypothetical protein